MPNVATNTRFLRSCLRFTEPARKHKITFQPVLSGRCPMRERRSRVSRFSDGETADEIGQKRNNNGNSRGDRFSPTAEGSRSSPVYTTSSRLISRQWPIGSFYFGRESQKDREMEACTCTWGEVAGKTRERFGNRGRKRLTTRGSVPNQRSYVVIPRRG